MKMKSMNWKMVASVVVLAIASMGSEASAEVCLGYCSEDIKSRITNSSTSATVSVSVAFTPDYYQPYKNLSIQSIEVGFYDVSKLKSAKIWIRHHLTDSVNQIEKVLDVAQLSKGWNTIELDSLFDLSTSTDTLYVGYDYTQRAKSSRIVGCSGTKCAYGLFAGTNGKWKDYSSTYEPLALRCRLVATLPHDLALHQLQLSPRTQLIMPGDTVRPICVTGELVNLGTEPIRSFDVCWKSGDGKQGRIPFSCDVNSCQYSSFSFDIEPPVANRNNCPVSVSLVLPDNDVDISNNGDTLYCEVLEVEKMGYPRQSMLVENYASMNNGFSPMAQTQFNDVVLPLCAKELGEDALVQIVQHRGYGPADELTVLENNPYSARAIFGEEELQYAPAVSVAHREVMSTSTLDPDTIASRIIQDYREQPYQFCRLSGSARCSGEKLYVEISAEANTLAWCVDPVLVVCLVRNKVALSGSKDYYNIYNNEEHNVIAAFLTPSTGYSLSNENGSRLNATQCAEFSSGRKPAIRTSIDGADKVEFVYSVPEDFNIADYHIVAYVCEMASDSQSVDAVVEIEIENK